LEIPRIEGRTPGELLLPIPAKELIAKAIAGASPLEGEFALEFPARRLLHATLVPVCVAGAGGSSSTLVVLRDLTALRRLERVRQDFVANVSHELRTPLAAVKLMVETLLRDDPGEARRREFLASVEAECDRLAALVNDLLTLAKLDGGKMPSSPRSVSLADLTGEIAARLFPPEAPRRPRLSFPPDLPPAKADPEHLRQILINLLDNAVRHTPEGTPFGVEAAFDAGWITVAVWDKGPGIPAAERERILRKEASVQVRHMFATSFQLSPNFLAEFKRFWNLPEDWNLTEEELEIPTFGSKHRMSVEQLPDVKRLVLVEE
ncbi:MAG: hypothetical protein K6U03_12805, partial [Firmicutes bacterium]|nr:hypothetical protein [Bacillota bacterium]